MDIYNVIIFLLFLVALIFLFFFLKDLAKIIDDLKESKNVSLIICPHCKSIAQRTFKERVIDLLKSYYRILKFTVRDSIKYNLKLLHFFKYDKWKKAGGECIQKYEKMECNNEEHAVVIVNNKKPGKSLFIYASGVDVLVNFFNSRSNPIKFKIYNCYNPKQFFSSINRSKAPNLWIIGHGNRHGISFGGEKEDYYPFCKIAHTPSRSFIAQLHCCDDGGTTLWEYLSENPGIFSEGFRIINQNRDDIEKWIKKQSITENKVL